MKYRQSKAQVEAGELKRSNKKGIALITVLAMMSLITILILTFFSLAQNEYTASTSYSRGLHAQQLAETAVNLVVAQLREGTITPKGQETRAWTSQPGAIRAFDSDGNFDRAYKLYSAEMMVDSNASNLIKQDLSDMKTWESSPAEYVDLNEPVIRGEKVYYPIVDPRAQDTPNWDTPFEGDDAGVEGFSYSLSAVGEGPLGEAVVDATGETRNTTLPMPAKWIYVLEDGSMGTLNSDTFTPFPNGNAATKENPIVGRVAFWTDDETSKLNVNTSAGGAAWDTPRAGGEIDRELGRFQPAQHEWQRYPGHPATTYLTSVLYPGIANITLEADKMETVFEIVPRIVGGGSQSGTKMVNPNGDEANGLIPDLDRLYPSLDELIFRPGKTAQRKEGDKASLAEREPNVFPEFGGAAASSDKIAETLERGKFFLTVTSRAPETNLFNRPRISMWPTYYARSASDEKYLTPFDELIRFCSEVGVSQNSNNDWDVRNIYHFQRKSADSPTYDFDQIDRNRMLWDYLDDLMHKDVPGFGASFVDKYGETNQRQLLTEIFDYIRCTNLFDDTVYDHANPGNDKSWEDAYKSVNDNKHLTYTNYRNSNERGLHMGQGQVTPIVPTAGNAAGTKGFGRFYTIDEVGIQLIACAVGADPGLNIGGPGIRSGIVDTELNPQGLEYSNFPPLLPTVSKTAPGNWKTAPPASWPLWMVKQWNLGRDAGNDELMKGGTEAEAEAKARPYQNWVRYALKEENWNWMLAWNGVDTPHHFNVNAIQKSDDSILVEGETMIQAVMLFKVFSPSSGWVALQPDFQFSVNTGVLSFGSSDKGSVTFEEEYDNPYEVGAAKGSKNHHTWVGNFHSMSGAWGGRHNGSSGGYRGIMRSTSGRGGNDPGARHGKYIGQSNNQGLKDTHPDFHSGWDAGRRTWFDKSGKDRDASDIYPFVTVPFVVNGSNVSISTSGGMDIKIMSHRGGNPTKGSNAAKNRLVSAPDAEAGEPQVVQAFRLNMNGFNGMPVPTLADSASEKRNEFDAIYTRETRPFEGWSASYDGANPINAAAGRLASSNRHPGSAYNPDKPAENASVGSYIRRGDTVWSMGMEHGDQRVIAAKKEVTGGGSNDDLQMHPKANGNNRMAHTFAIATGALFYGASGEIITDAKYSLGKRPQYIHGNAEKYQRYGDFDTGMGGTNDGAFINKPDEGNTHSLYDRGVEQQPGSWEFRRDYGNFPYFVREWTQEAASPSYFSPNRMMPSSGMLGSLPTMTADPTGGNVGSSSTEYGAWQTLLFRPNVEGSGQHKSHPGARTPPDHLIMDLFWMPVVEPYAISEPFSTAGKINLNYQILPYTYVKRATGLYGVFKSEYMQCIPNKWAQSYKSGVGRGKGYHWKFNPYGGELQKISLRAVINEPKTLEQFDEKFDNGEVFISATEICEMHLVPTDISSRLGYSAGTGTYTPSVQQMKSGKYWDDHKLVGDNGREMPYTHIYPRVTTKSNTFKVHYRAQIVTKAKGTQPDVWDLVRDQAVAEFRGSTIVERYLEPGDPNIPDYGQSDPDDPDIDQFYRYRVINPTRFAP